MRGLLGSHLALHERTTLWEPTESMSRRAEESERSLTDSASGSWHTPCMPSPEQPPTEDDVALPRPVLRREHVTLRSTIPQGADDHRVAGSSTSTVGDAALMGQACAESLTTNSGSNEVHTIVPFDRTTSGLDGFVADMVTNTEHPLAALLIAYERQLESTTGTSDRSLLEAAKPLLEQQVKQTVLDPETVRLGKALYAYLGNPEALLQLLARYREQPLAPDEEAWARWHEVDNLALLRRCEEAVEA